MKIHCSASVFIQLFPAGFTSGSGNLDVVPRAISFGIEHPQQPQAREQLLFPPGERKPLCGCGFLPAIKPEPT